MILRSACDLLDIGIFADISRLLPRPGRMFLKIEAFNAAGSIKLKPAITLVSILERAGTLKPGASIIDTTSGNMGVALAVVAKTRGYGFICVTDEKMTAHTRALVDAYGAELVVLTNSNLDERYSYIESRIRVDRSLVWTRQFLSPDNPAAHEQTTALEILREFSSLNYLFIGVGTGGTVAGCSRVFRQKSPQTKLIAVDAEGSCHFQTGTNSVRRHIPGIGATKRSPFLQGLSIGEAIVVSERDAIRMCELLREKTGWLVGGSTGSVVAAALKMSNEFKASDTIVCVSADLGERYLDTVFDSAWVNQQFGAEQSTADVDYSPGVCRVAKPVVPIHPVNKPSDGQ